MESHIDFKLKKGGPSKDKIILFAILKQEIFPNNKELKNQIINKYVEIIKNNPNIYVVFDCRAVKKFSKKIVWEGASQLYKHNELFYQNIRASSLLISNNDIIKIANLIQKVHPFVTPTKFCKDNKESLNFIYSHMK